jgi:hypothetical protein
MVLALVRDDLAELGLEPGRTGARRAVVEVFGDLAPAVLGELAVEVVIELMDRRAAVDVGIRVAGRSS